jgi:exodeoxyribonuclease VII small subunit
MNNSNSTTVNFSFEQAMNRLEQIITELNSNKINLDDMIKLHNEANELHNFCQQKLQEAQLKMEIIKN